MESPPLLDAAELAIKCAKSLARKWRFRDYRELVSGCYEGIVRARAAGARESRMLIAARYGVYDWLRTESLSRRKGHFVPVQFGHDVLQGFDQPFFDAMGETVCAGNVPDSRPAEPSSRLMDLWAETKPLRANHPIRDRVLVYLYVVEMMTMRDAGAALNLSESRASQIIAKFSREVRNVGAATECRAASGESETPSGSGPRPCLGDQMEPARFAPEGNPPCPDPGDLAETAYPRIVADASGPLDLSRSGPDERRAPHLHPDPRNAGLHRPHQAEQTLDGGADAGPVPAVSQALVGGRGRRSVGAITTSLPNGISAKAAALRSGMLDSVGSEDMTEVVQAVLARAKKGNLAAAKIMIALVGGSK